MLEKLTIIGGNDKEGNPENVKLFEIDAGMVFAIVGPTGSGKTQLISDIEQFIDDSETISGRSILINNHPASEFNFNKSLRYLIAEVSQNMNFVIDITVENFLLMHTKVREIENQKEIIDEALKITNELAGEPVYFSDNLTKLSGGQSRALMVADAAVISKAPILLIDEIENAGINRLKALEILKKQGKIILVITHDPTLLLMADKRIVMKNGGMNKLHITSTEEKELLKSLVNFEEKISNIRDYIRNGGIIKEKNFDI
ncbi:ATP-binding cassette domain-containing protein [Anaerovorax odorimutans]|uniref:ATP-binding cassette domain-containing protein n=1 Tax=Anaerovorax odorimutans TaxID=109327 RepID=UPI0004266B43|nr:ATP-binding cassette domain-containing protein [Anaerovorax odorimutans]